MKYMFKKIFTLVASAVISLTAGQAWAQSVEISNDGWGLLYANGESGSLVVNTWSSEGNTDDSGMTAPFLQQHSGTGELPQSQWKKTISGLVPRGAYVYTVLIRAYREGGATTPHGVSVYAGTEVSDDITTGSPILSSTAKGYFKTYFLNCEADENGNLEVGVNIAADNGCNWVAIKNMALYRTSVSSFMRVTDGKIESGAKYFLVHHDSSNSEDGIALDGNYRNISDKNAVYNNKLRFTSHTNWQGTKALLDVKNAYQFVSNSGNYAIIGNQGSKCNLYPGAGFIVYGPDYITSVTPNNNGTFRVQRPSGTIHYLVFDGTNFIGSTSSTGSDLYLYKQHASFSLPQSHYEAVVDDAFVIPQITKEGGGDWTLNYTSSNTAVAIVDNTSGAVTLVGPGTAYINALYAHDSNVGISYYISVKNRGVISWNPQKQFEVGNDVTNRLNISTNSNGQVTFTSSDPNVLAVSEDGHTVTAVGLGTATLQAMVSSTDQYTAATSIAVSISVVPSSPNLTFAANSSTTIYVDDELQTSVSHLGNGRITYSSSNESVAKIDDEGKVQGLNAGTATITATISAAGYYKAESKTISVTVRKYTVGMTGLLSSATMAVGDVQTLSVTSESTGKKVYRSSNDKVATVSDKGIITAVGPGTAAIYYKIDENYKYGAIAEKSVSVSVKHNMSAKVNPSAIVLSVGAKKNFEIQVPQGYTGSYTVTMLQQGIATVSGTGTTREVTGVAPGSATIHIEFPATATYYGGSIDIPVTVLGIYQYQLTVVNAPSHGVSISICGVNYNEPTVFNSSHESITVSDVVVKAVPGFTSTVTVTGKEIKVTYSLIIPQKGTFVRIKNYYYNKYASMPAADNAVLTMDDANMGNIFYYDNDGHLLFYQNGQYVSYTNQMSKVKDAADASVFDFVNSSTNALYKECFKVKVKNGTSYLHGGATATTQGNGNAAEAYWYVETLNELPVALSANGLGYGSLYCPVPLEVPGGVTAYYISNRNNTGPGSSNVEHTLTLSPIASNIPANTPVILVGVPGMTYSFTLKYGASVSPISSMLIGHCAAQVTSVLANGGTVFALQPNEGQHRVDFYKYTQANTKGFKAYFVESVSTGAAYYRLVFEGEEATDILQLEAIEAQETIYDLCGRSMGNNVESLPRGIYVRAGRKFVVK